VVDRGLTSPSADGYELVVGPATQTAERVSSGPVPDSRLPDETDGVRTILQGKAALGVTDHLGIRVCDLPGAIQGFEALGFQSHGVEDYPEVGLEIAFLEKPGTDPGAARVELMRVTSPDSPVRDASPGLHHIAFRCQCLDSCYEALCREPSVKIVNGISQGAHGRRIFFFRIADEPALFECVAARPSEPGSDA
jgi:hypothetical protein